MVNKKIKKSERRIPITAITLEVEKKKALKEIMERVDGESISSLIGICIDLSIQDIEFYLKMKKKMQGE